MSRYIGPEDLESAQPRLEGELSVRGIASPIRVIRDRWGIPHIRAHSAAEAFFGQGFVHAQDRLWQMDYDRRRALGRWAEWVGEEGLESDILMRKMGLERAARRDYEHATPEARDMLERYAQGVNEFMRTAGSLPVEYRLIGSRPEPWEPWHSLGVYKVRHVSMGSWELKMLRARLLREVGPEKAAWFFPPYGEGEPLIVPVGGEYESREMWRALEEFQGFVDGIGWLETEGTGSNNWVVSGRLTESGWPLMAGDPHRPLEVPNVYYQNHVACDEFDVVGLSFAGVPGFPHFGHNGRVAWCITHTGADTQDIYQEQFRKGKDLEYRGPDGWEKAEVRNETVHVAGRDPVESSVVETRHGPVIAGDPDDGWGLAFRYVATAEADSTIDCFLPMMRASGADQLEEAVRAWVDPCNCMLFADVEGEIGLRVRGKLPVRSSANAWLPVPGWTGEHEWEGYVPFEEMPGERSPDADYIVTANNKVTGDDYPHYISTQFAPGYRARRILDRLQGRSGLRLEHMEEIHADTVSVPAQRLRGAFDMIRPKDDSERRVLEGLLKWDARMDEDSWEATVYSVWRQNLLKALLGFAPGLLGEIQSGHRGSTRAASNLGLMLPEALADPASNWLPEGKTWPELATEAFTSAVLHLKSRLGDDHESWRWGLIHRNGHSHPLRPVVSDEVHHLNPKTVPLGGDGDTVRSAAYLPLTGDFDVVIGSAARYAFDLSNWDGSSWTVPLGASGHPGSKHFCDQVDSWSQVKSIPMLYSWESIEGSSGQSQVLSPDRVTG